MSTNTTIALAEIRVHVHNHSSLYPVRLNGHRRVDYIFPRDGRTGKMQRRYVCGTPDPDRGIYPLAQAADDMADIQLADLGNFKLVWSFIGKAEYDADETAHREAEARQQQDDADRVAERDRLAQVAEDATLEAERLSEPGATVAPETPKAKPAKKGQRPSVLDSIAGGTPA
jgi:hypothetical protein